jgi:hypothetical protein
VGVALACRNVQQLTFAQEIDGNPPVPFSHSWCGKAEILARKRMKSDHAAVNRFRLILFCLAGWINHNQQNIIESAKSG